MFLRVVASSIVAMLLSYSPMTLSHCGPIGYVKGPVTYYYTAKGRIYAAKVGDQKYYCSAKTNSYVYVPKTKHVYHKHSCCSKHSHKHYKQVVVKKYYHSYPVHRKTYVYYNYPYRYYTHKTYVYRAPANVEHRYYRYTHPYYYDVIFWRR